MRRRGVAATQVCVKSHGFGPSIHFRSTNTHRGDSYTEIEREREKERERERERERETDR